MMKFPRWWLRLLFRLFAATATIAALVLLSDFKLNFLPPLIQTKLPLHRASSVITDIQIVSCISKGGCSLDPEKGWSQLPKDLFLGQAWLKHAFLNVQSMGESELSSNTKVVLDVALSRTPRVVPDEIIQSVRDQELDIDSLDNAALEKAALAVGWVLRDPEKGLWVKYGKFKPSKSLSGIKILFGNHAAYPVPGWKLIEGKIHLPDSHLPPRLALHFGATKELARPVLKVNGDTHKFKIVQLADLHFVAGPGKCDRVAGFVPAEDEPLCLADKRTTDYIEKILDEEKPDLVVYTGDQIMGGEALDIESAILKGLAPSIARELPYAVVFGNHDDQGSLDNEAMMDIIESLPYSLASRGPTEVDGVGNYILQALVNNHPALTLYFLDTHARRPGLKSYDWIHENQIQFVRDKYSEVKLKQEQYSHIPLSMAFFHIPLPEYRDSLGPIKGKYLEGVTGPTKNSGALEALQAAGVSITSVGHDHCNDFCRFENTNTEHPVWLCYGGGVGEGGYGGYPDPDGVDYIRRIRVYEINTQDSTIKSWKRVRGEDHIVDEQLLVSGGKAIGP